MSDATTVSFAASPAMLIQPLGASLAPAQTLPAEPQAHINVNAPAYVNPAISFDPVTNVVIFTYRNSETGKVTEQIPPAQALSRYQQADETGVAPPSAQPPSPTPASAPPPPPANAAPASPAPSVSVSGMVPGSSTIA